MVPRATLDYETRSTCELKKAGAWRYSLDPTTEVLCLAFRLPHWTVGRTELWHPAFPTIGLDEGENFDALWELILWIRDGGLLEAHNSFFERSIWANIQVPRYGWPAVDGGQWRCSAAKAAACALPRGLGHAGEAMSLTVAKDDQGHKAMLKMCKPRKPRKAEREAWAAAHGSAPHPVLYWESPDLLSEIFDYCRQDVLAEEAISSALPDLSPAEVVMHQLDQTINERGFQLDKEAVHAAQSLIKAETIILNRELAELTEGQVERATQRARMQAWFEQEGLWLPNTQKETLDEAMAGLTDLPAHVQRALHVVRTLGRSSTAKYETMAAQMSPTDSRVRGGLLYHGATTGRWSGSGVQPHNFPKGTLKVDQEALWTALKRQNRDEISRLYKSPMEALSHGLRGAIVASPGKQLYVADYAAIEARVLAWEAGDRGALRIFHQDQDPYCVLASEIYGYPCTKVNNPKERELGKTAELGLGYQMGAAKFVATCATKGITITEAFSKKVVDTYRAKHAPIKAAWYAQEAAVIEAVTDGDEVRCGHVTWYVEDDFLWGVLPSGRRLAYPFPEVRIQETSWGEMKEQLTFMSVDSYSHQWKRQHTYGGMIVENIVQAIARDMLAEALLRSELSGVYLPVLSVHDELICEAPLGQGSVLAFENMMSKAPTWAPDCPIKAEGYSATRYRKA